MYRYYSLRGLTLQIQVFDLVFIQVLEGRQTLGCHAPDQRLLHGLSLQDKVQQVRP